jgi:hypothetical protein
MHISAGRHLKPRMVIASLVAGLVTGLATRHACAQVGDTHPSPLFLEDTYVGILRPHKGTMYEARPALHIFVGGSTDSLYSTVLAPKGGWGRGSMWVITPMFRIRQMRGDVVESSPVRTPSFMPRIVLWQTLRARRLGSLSGRTILGVTHGPRLAFSHYSNGQAGCFLFSERKEPDPHDPKKLNCRRVDSLPPAADSLNVVDGSFSTWYLTGGWNFRLTWYDAGSDTPVRTVSAVFTVDWHSPAFLGIGGMDAQLERYYGRFRPALELAWRETVLDQSPLPVRVRLVGEGEWVTRRPTGIPPLRYSLTASVTVPRAYGAGVFARIHRGQDYYNIALAERLHGLQFGVVFDLDRDLQLPYVPGARREH